MRSFTNFLDSKTRSNKEHLHLLQHILSKAGFQTENHLDDDKEPYVYIKKPVDVDPIIEHLSFDGVRLFTRGKDLIVYRAQNKSESEPYGTARQIDIKGMFKDLVHEASKDLIGNRIIFNIIQELTNYFLQSAKAEREEDAGGPDSQLGAITAPGTTGGTDYSLTVFDKPDRL